MHAYGIALAAVIVSGIAVIVPALVRAQDRAHERAQVVRSERVAAYAEMLEAVNATALSSVRGAEDEPALRRLNVAMWRIQLLAPTHVHQVAVDAGMVAVDVAKARAEGGAAAANDLGPKLNVQITTMRDVMAADLATIGARAGRLGSR